MKRVIVLFLSFLLCVSLLACGGESVEDSSMSDFYTEPSENIEDLGELVILFTGGLENVFERNADQGFIGYAALASYQDQLEDTGYQVVLVDGGASVGGDGAAAFDGGDALWEIIDTSGYDIRIPGALELSAGPKALQDRADDLTSCTYISCNLTEVSSGAFVFDPYVIVDTGARKIGFVGITAPDAEKSLQADQSVVQYSLCQDEKQAFYEAVQQAIDSAANAGADYVIGVGNLGTDPSDSPWTSVEIIANTTGFAAFLDCGSGAVLEGDIVLDKDDFEIPVCAPGSEFCYVGQLNLDLNDGSVSVVLLDELEDEDKDIHSMAEALASDMEAATEPVEDTTAETTD